MQVIVGNRFDRHVWKRILYYITACNQLVKK